MEQYCICYNLIDHNFENIPPLPEAYIASMEEGILKYIEKNATEATLRSYSLSIGNTDHQHLLNICDELKPSALEQRFQPKKRRKTVALAALEKDSKINEVLLNFVHRRLNTFYELLQQNQYPITLAARRKEHLENFRLHIAKTPIEPILKFTKTNEGIEYAFQLNHEQNKIIPHKHSIQILLNEPSWIIVNQYIAQLRSLNANKLKPFQNKEKIIIQQKHVKTYLDRVIVPIIKNLEVEAQGFDIIYRENIASYGIEFIKDFMSDKYFLNVVYTYENHTFHHNSNKKTSTIVNSDNDQIEIIQTRRNPEKEQHIWSRLIKLGLSVNQSLLFDLDGQNDSYAIINWVKKNKIILIEEGFEIHPPLHLDKILNLDPHSIEITNSKKNDWFDIKGMVTIGEQQIPFSRFVKYIRNNDRHFPLDNATVFIIPEEWMNRYKKLAAFGKVENDTVIINKSNYTVLKDVLPSDNLIPEDLETIDYKPSPDLKATLRPYQLEGVQWLVNHYHNGLGACLADDMGLGKTLQTIATLLYAKEQLQPNEEEVERIQFDLFSSPLEIKTYLKALIVLPSSLVFNWAQEILKFAPHLNIVKYTGPDRKKITPYLETYDVVLTTYTTLAKDIEAFKKSKFNYLIIDESQQIKNRDSKIFQAINKVPVIHKISLSGTPIENSLADLWSQMQFINPGILGSFSFFKDHFMIPIEKHHNEDKIEELKSLIDPFILRRTKEQVAKDLPELSEQVLYTQMHPKQEKLYESEKSAARNLLLGLNGGTVNKINVINTLTKLRQIANHPILMNAEQANTSGKFEDVTHYLQTLVKANKKVLVFSSFVSHLALYEEWCANNQIKYITLTGQTATQDRAEIVNNFQKDASINIFFISLKAGGVGLNLTAASYVVLLDPWWNPFIEKQAIARSHRIGQQNQVMVTRFITKNTIEEKILQLQERKKALSDEVIDINSIPEYIEEELEKLLG